MAIAFCVIIKGLATEVALIDLNEEAVDAEVRDLQAVAEYYPKCQIYGGANYKLVSNSTIIVMCERIPPMDDESKLANVQRGLDVFKRIIPHIVESSPESLIMVVSEP
uniref:Ldh_1_N domain-containing protein n=1 Tax=Mesocestoides corti TaxID=53468 RepID=A0A5K3FU42_MESCO